MSATTFLSFAAWALEVSAATAFPQPMLAPSLLEMETGANSPITPATSSTAPTNRTTRRTVTFELLRHLIRRDCGLLGLRIGHRAPTGRITTGTRVATLQTVGDSNGQRRAASIQFAANREASSGGARSAPIDERNPWSTRHTVC